MVKAPTFSSYRTKWVYDINEFYYVVLCSVIFGYIFIQFYSSIVTILYNTACLSETILSQLNSYNLTTHPA